MSHKISLNFDKPTISRGVIDLLQNGLVEDTEQTLSKLTLKECLSVLARGNKLQFAPANYLLNGLLRMLAFDDSSIEDEIAVPGSQEEKELGKDLTLTQSLEEGCSKDSQATEDKKKSNPKESPSNKKKEICRFYTNGKCKYNTDCRFLHPKICPKFVQSSGSMETARARDALETASTYIQTYAGTHLKIELAHSKSVGSST